MLLGWEDTGKLGVDQRVRRWVDADEAQLFNIQRWRVQGNALWSQEDGLLGVGQDMCGLQKQQRDAGEDGRKHHVFGVEKESPGDGCR